MNEYSTLILKYSDRTNTWNDVTKNVLWISKVNNAYKVKYVDSYECFVSLTKMRILNAPKKVDYYEVYYNNTICKTAKRLLLFNNSVYKIFYENGYTSIAYPNEIKVITDVLRENEKAKNIMEYYRSVVEYNIRTEEDEFLLNQFKKIDYVNKSSVLALYLDGRLGKTYHYFNQPVIAPFGINLSQSSALKMMLSNRISVVEGPPGTGKTQTILNFIANAIINNQSVAVVSNNNAATDNVYEKLNKYGYSFLAAKLGNSNNVESFFDEATLPVPEIEKRKFDLKELESLAEYLPDYFIDENRKKKLNEKLNGLEIEYKHFLKDYEGINFKFDSNIKIKSKEILDLIVLLKESKKKLSFWTKFKLLRKFKMKNTSLLTESLDVIACLNNLYYINKIKEIKKEILIIEKRMNSMSFVAKMNLYVDYSKKYFENHVADNFDNKTRSLYKKDNYKNYFEQFVKDYPVVLSSTYSLLKCCKKGFLFDYLVIDESSQVNMASAILSMNVAKNIVIVGDIKQLPQIDDVDFEKTNEFLMMRYNIPKEYSYFGNSIMSSFLSLYGHNIPKTMLKEHYRCNPDIIGFCNKQFYNNELVIYTERLENDYSMKIIKTLPGNFARKNPNGSGLYNQREIDEIDELLKREHLEDVGVVTPYRYHAELVQQQLKEKVEASTIHKFQGREKETIIFTTTINDLNEFVENDNLINVAVSRAVSKFILVTSDKVYNSNNGVLSNLINYIKYNNEFSEMEEGAIRSIYDMLYDDYRESLEKFRKRYPSKYFDTENITKQLLRKILSDSKYNILGFVMHVSLKDFISNTNLGLTNEEYKFYMNPNSHADFLIFNKITHKPLLVIEVDGVSYHEQSKEQNARDKKKNAILEKANIKIIRLKTNGSKEEEKIIESLDSLI